MVASKKDSNPAANRPPATTPQGQENRVISIAYEVAERQLLAGTASSQVIVHFLKLGTAREQLERMKLEQEAQLAQAKVEAIAQTQKLEELTERAIAAFSGYQPSRDEDFE